MKLISLFIENFGKLHRYSIDFSDGQNTVCEENGWGKSTLAAFIKAMFYGLPRSRVQSLDDNERKKYEPWQGGSFGGNLVFECTRGKFRVERSFGDSDSFLLSDLSTGLPSSAFSETLGQELFGIDADGFERSVYLSARSLAPSGKNDTVRAKLTGAIEDANDMRNFERAYETLDSRAKEYKKTGNRGKIGELEAEIRALNEEIRSRRNRLSEQQEKEKQLSDLRAELAKVSADAEQLQKYDVLATQLEDKQRREEEIRRLEKQRQSIRSTFEGALPSAEELEQQRRLVHGIAEDSAELRTIGLDSQEQEELVRLSAVFPTGIPDKTTLQHQYAAAAELRAEKSRIATERNITEHTISDAEKALRSLPSESELAAVSDTLNRASQQSSDTKSSFPRILFPVALLFSAVGIPLLILGVLKSHLLFTIGGGASLITGMVCLLLTRVGSSSKQAQTASTRERKESERAALELLTRLGRPAGDDPRLTLAALSEEVVRSRRAKAEAEVRLAELRNAETDLRVKENDLRAFLATYGIAEADTESGLRRLSEQSRDWDRLYQKQRKAEHIFAEKKQALAEKTAQAERFFSRCSAAVGTDAEERLRAVERLVSDDSSLSEQIARQKETLRIFLSEKGLDTLPVDIASIDLAARSSEIESLKQKRNELSEQERKWTLLIDRMKDETEKISESEENVDRLKEELEDVKNRHRLLKLTCDYLKESREALTTRYLPETRKNFEKYLSWITGENAPQADVNAEFGVTVIDGGMTRQSESYSRGWRDILQFCVRLSLVDALFENGEKPFLLLDDPFTNLDEKRLVFAKELLSRLADEFQILYLVCHGDRA